MIKDVYDNDISSSTVGRIVSLTDDCGLRQFAPSQRENRLLDIWQFARSEPESTIDTAEMIKNLFNSELDLLIEVASSLVSLGLKERRNRNER